MRDGAREIDLQSLPEEAGDENIGPTGEQLADIAKFGRDVEIKRPLRKGLEKVQKARQAPETADEAIEGVLAMHEEDALKQEAEKDMKKWEQGRAEETARKAEETARKAAESARTKSVFKKKDAIEAETEAWRGRTKARKEAKDDAKAIWGAAKKLDEGRKEAKKEAGLIWGAAKKLDEEREKRRKEDLERADERGMQEFGGTLPISKAVSGESATIYDNPPEELKQGYEQPSVIIEDAETVDAMEAERESEEDAARIWGAARKLDKEREAKERADERGMGEFGGALPISKAVSGESTVIYDNPPEELKQGYEQPSVIIEDAETVDAMEKDEADWEQREREAAEVLGEEGLKEVRAEIDEVEREREAVKVLGVKGLEKIDAEIDEVQRKRELDAELNVLVEETGLLQKEREDLGGQLKKMGFDDDKPRGLFGRIGLGAKRLFNRDFKKVHDAYVAKTEEWQKTLDRTQEIRRALGKR